MLVVNKVVDNNKVILTDTSNGLQCEYSVHDLFNKSDKEIMGFVAYDENNHFISEYDCIKTESYKNACEITQNCDSGSVTIIQDGGYWYAITPKVRERSETKDKTKQVRATQEYILCSTYSGQTVYLSPGCKFANSANGAKRFSSYAGAKRCADNIAKKYNYEYIWTVVKVV